MAIDEFSAPGLYVVELPSNAHSIQAAPKSITVFVGYTHPFKTRRFRVAVAVDSFTEYEREFGGLYRSGLVSSHVAYAVSQFFLNGGAQAYVVGLRPFYWRADNSRISRIGPVSSEPASASIGEISFFARELTDLIPMRVTIDNIPPAKPDRADVTITYGPTIETYRQVSLDPKEANFIETRIGTASQPVSGLVTVKARSASKFTRASNVTLEPQPRITRDTVATTFSEADFAADQEGPGVFDPDGSLDKVDVFNLLLLPGITDVAVCSAALAFAERKQAFAILDPPAQAAADGSEGLPPMQVLWDHGVLPQSQNGAIYFPYLRTIDPLSASQIELPPSGFVAGKIAQTDQVGPWLAPAGLGTVIATTTGVVPRGKLTDARLGQLNQRGINSLRTLPGIGTVIWGARTLVAGNPAFEQWKYIPVRRLALFIEQSLLTSLGWAVFQPNDDPLYLALRTTVSSFMLSLFNQGAFEGATPSQAFKVVCDRTTTTDQDRADGTCNILVAFRPLKPAEFVVIKIAQLAGQAAA